MRPASSSRRHTGAGATSRGGPRATVLVGLLVALTVAGGCAGAQDGVPDPFSGGDRDRPAQLLVRNRNFNDATIWAVYPTDRLRVGIAPGKSDTRLTLPRRRFSEPLYLDIDLVGGERCRTDVLVVDPGDLLELDIHPEASAVPECRRG